MLVEMAKTLEWPAMREKAHQLQTQLETEKMFVIFEDSLLNAKRGEELMYSMA